MNLAGSYRFKVQSQISLDYITALFTLHKIADVTYACGTVVPVLYCTHNAFLSYFFFFLQVVQKIATDK